MGRYPSGQRGQTVKRQRPAERQDGKVGEFREVRQRIVADNPEPSSLEIFSEKVQRLSAYHLKLKTKVMR